MGSLGGEGGAHWDFRVQNPTLHIASLIVASSAAIIALMQRVPPRATRSLVTAASVTSSFVWDESMRETRVAKR